MVLAKSKSAATPWVLFGSIQARLDLWNEVQYPSELPLASKIQAVKVERSKKTSVLLLIQTFYSNVQLWRLVFLDPVWVQRHTVPLFKGLFKLNLNQKRPRAWHHFICRSRSLKKSHFMREKEQSYHIQVSIQAIKILDQFGPSWSNLVQYGLWAYSSL